MLFPYLCQKCGNRFDMDLPIGKAPREAPCPLCKSKSKRVYDGMSIAVKIDGGYHRTSNFGEQMKVKNLRAGEKMKAKRPGLRLAAYDYGGGDIREVRQTK